MSVLNGFAVALFKLKRSGNAGDLWLTTTDGIRSNRISTMLPRFGMGLRGPIISDLRRVHARLVLVCFQKEGVLSDNSQAQSN